MTDKKVALSTKIKKLRAERNLSQKDLANLTRISISEISFIERGVKKPRMNTLMKIAKAFQIDEEELLSFIY